MSKPKQFVPKEKNKRNKKGVLMTPYQALTLEEIVKWLAENGTAEDKKIFKKNYLGEPDENGDMPRPMFLQAKRQFCERHCPEILPKTPSKVNLYDMMKDW